MSTAASGFIRRSTSPGHRSQNYKTDVTYNKSQAISIAIPTIMTSKSRKHSVIHDRIICNFTLPDDIEPDSDQNNVN